MFEKFVSGNFRLLNSAVSEGEDISVFGLNLGEKLALLEDSAFLFFVVENEDKIITILDKIKDYEDFLFYLYNLLRESVFLIQIDFLENLNFPH